MGAKPGQGMVNVEVGGLGYARPGKTPETGNAGGSLHVDTQVNEALSIPASLTIGFSPGIVGLRAGARYRFWRYLSLGGGATLSFSSFWASGGLDGEVAFGHRWDWFSLSLVGRPTFMFNDFSHHMMRIYLLSELTAAIFVFRGFAATFHILVTYVPKDFGDEAIYEDDVANDWVAVGGGAGFVAYF